MAAHDLCAADLTGTVVQRYLADRRAAGYTNYRSLKAMRPLLDYLERLGVLPVEEDLPQGPVAELLTRYTSYLLTERGVTRGTARCYVDAVTPFVTSRLRDDGLDWAGLGPADITGYVVAT